MKRIIFALLFLSAFAAYAGKTTVSLPYSYSKLDNKTSGQPGATIPGIVLMGGGTDVDAAFKWMCDRAGNGDFLVVRATGTNGYNSYIKKLCPKLKSVATLIIPSLAAANTIEVASYIQNAQAIFIAGGDQSDYINYWKGTLTQDALQDQITNGTPIGGTSAGMMVLTEFLYPAFAATGVTSSQALADPYNIYMSLDRGFVSLGLLKNTFGDSHFSARDRMGRDLAFLCQINKKYFISKPRSISVDEQTALLIDQDGKGTVAGNGNVYFLEATTAPTTCESGKTLTYEKVNVHRTNASGNFDLNKWSGLIGTDYSVSAIEGVLSSTQPGGSPY